MSDVKVWPLDLPSIVGVLKSDDIHPKPSTPQGVFKPKQSTSCRSTQDASATSYSTPMGVYSEASTTCDYLWHSASSCSDDKPKERKKKKLSTKKARSATKLLTSKLGIVGVKAPASSNSKSGGGMMLDQLPSFSAPQGLAILTQTSSAEDLSNYSAAQSYLSACESYKAMPKVVQRKSSMDIDPEKARKLRSLLHAVLSPHAIPSRKMDSETRKFNEKLAREAYITAPRVSYISASQSPSVRQTSSVVRITSSNVRSTSALTDQKIAIPRMSTIFSPVITSTPVLPVKPHNVLHSSLPGTLMLDEKAVAPISTASPPVHVRAGSYITKPGMFWPSLTSFQTGNPVKYSDKKTGAVAHEGESARMSKGSTNPASYGSYTTVSDVEKLLANLRTRPFEASRRGKRHGCC